MNAKVTNPFHVLYFTDTVTLKDLQKYVRTKAHELYKEAVSHNLEITGPVYWMYDGMDGNPDRLFTLEIAIPISKNEDYQGRFNVKCLDLFKHVSAVHLGDWMKLPETYGAIFQEIGQNGIIPSGVCREIYQFIDFDNPHNNITEVQVGIL